MSGYEGLRLLPKFDVLFNWTIRRNEIQGKKRNYLESIPKYNSGYIGNPNNFTEKAFSIVMNECEIELVAMLLQAKKVRNTLIRPQKTQTQSISLLWRELD